MEAVNLESYIRDIPDFPKPGIIFKDITPLLADCRALEYAIRRMTEPYFNLGITKVVGIEARGFLFAPSVALALGAGVVPVRKPGKLPYKTKSYTYDLEYGTDTIEIHHDAIEPGEKILVIDDLLATGGTVNAACELIKILGGDVVGIAF
ncbi:MAG TPA: adenine phosphoribosyltransferase, partial [bacterium]|nr:adenine phosphoribosyltransferase [bacterium]